MEKYTVEKAKDTLVAVVLSDAYGLGWSTQVHDRALRDTMLFDKQIVERVLSKQPITREFLQDIIPGNEIYLPEDREAKLRVSWVKQGERFAVIDYDGKESLLREKDLRIA